MFWSAFWAIETCVYSFNCFNENFGKAIGRSCLRAGLAIAKYVRAVSVLFVRFPGFFAVRSSSSSPLEVQRRSYFSDRNVPQTQLYRIEESSSRSSCLSIDNADLPLYRRLRSWHRATLPTTSPNSTRLLAVLLVLTKHNYSCLCFAMWFGVAAWVFRPLRGWRRFAFYPLSCRVWNRDGDGDEPRLIQSCSDLFFS